MSDEKRKPCFVPRRAIMHEVKRLRALGKDDATIAVRLNVPVSKVREASEEHET